MSVESKHSSGHLVAQQQEGLADQTPLNFNPNPNSNSNSKPQSAFHIRVTNQRGVNKKNHHAGALDGDPYTNNLHTTKTQDHSTQLGKSGQQEQENPEKGSQEKENQEKASKAATKKALFNHPKLWRAGRLDQQSQSHDSIQTGFTALDEHLPGQGWPLGGLVEMLLASTGIGELRLLLPVMQALTNHADETIAQQSGSHIQEHKWLAWINPPFIPYAPALQAAGIDTNKILLVHPQNHKDMLWALERASKSGTCSAVLAWPDEKKLKLKDTQRLQVAAKQGRTLTCLFRPQQAQLQTSMAELRLAVTHTGEPGTSRIDILKRRGGWPVQDITLVVNDGLYDQHHRALEVKQQLGLWRALQHQQNQPHHLDAETHAAGDDFFVEHNQIAVHEAKNKIGINKQSETSHPHGNLSGKTAAESQPSQAPLKQQQPSPNVDHTNRHMH